MPTRLTTAHPPVSSHQERRLYPICTWVFALRSISLLHVQGDHLELGHFQQRISAADPPDAAALAGKASDRGVRLPVSRRLVYVDSSGLEPLGDPHRAPDVLGEDAAD